MKRLICGLILLTLFSTAGCSTVSDYASMARDEGIPSKAYLETLNHWTRDRIVYSEFETKARIAATLRSPEFIEAYRKEYARIYDPGAAGANTVPDPQSRAGAEFLEFYFYAFVPDRDNNDFAKANSTWKIYLVDANGKLVQPSDLREITKVTPVIEQFFPYVNRYHGKFYSLRFPAATAGTATGGKPEPIRVIFTSVLAKVELEW
ncbi:MAG TPA: hypothetical protein VFG28_12150 [Syntrophales bacterium]|nr:hypothetical protein [Syntrophales bacterium]